MSDTSIATMEALCSEAFQLRIQIDAIEDGLKEKRELLDALNSKILLLLEAHNKNKWETNSGVFQIRERTSVRTPKTDEEKRKLFEWLQNKGIFWSTVSVNSNTLNALYKNQMEVAAQEGTDVVIPGVGEPEIYRQIVISRKR